MSTVEFGTRRLGPARSTGKLDAIWRKSLDRTAVLAVGVGLGAMIGHAFTVQPQAARTAAPIVAAPAPNATGLNAPGPAKTAVTPPPVAPRLLDALSKGRTIHVGVFGDSFGDGVWAGLRQHLPASAGYEVTKFSQQGTGFTRYQQVNLETRTAAQVAAAPVDIAVIDFGANDVQGLFDGAGHVQRLLSPGWQKVYGDRAEALVRILQKQGAAVYWVGLPRMRSADYDGQIAAIGEVVRQRMDRLGVPFIPVRSLSVDAKGDYDDYLTEASGRRRLMRVGDGVHMTMAGYARLTTPVTARIGADVAELRKSLHPGATCPVPAVRTAAQHTDARRPSPVA